MRRLVRVGNRMRRPGPLDTVEYATRWLEQRLSKGDSVVCPVSGVYLKVYPRALNAGEARALIYMYRAWGVRKWGDLPKLQVWVAERHPNEQRSGRKFHPLGGEEAKLRYWGFIEQDPNREGWYRITEEAEDFVMGRTRVPKYALVLNDNGRCVGLAGPAWSIRQALGKKFDLEELLSETPFHIPVERLRLVRGNHAG